MFNFIVAKDRATITDIQIIDLTTTTFTKTTLHPTFEINIELIVSYSEAANKGESIAVKPGTTRYKRDRLGGLQYRDFGATDERHQPHRTNHHQVHLR